MAEGAARPRLRPQDSLSRMYDASEFLLQRQRSVELRGPLHHPSLAAASYGRSPTACRVCRAQRRFLRVGARSNGGALAFRRSTAAMRRGPDLGSAPGRASWNHRIQAGGPSPAPVQPAPRSPVTRRTVDARTARSKVTSPHPGTAPAPSIGCHRSTSLRWASWPYVTITVTMSRRVSTLDSSCSSLIVAARADPFWRGAADAAGEGGPGDGFTLQEPRLPLAMLARHSWAVRYWQSQ